MSSKILKRIKLDGELCNMIQKNWFEYNGLKEIVVQFTSTSPWKPDKERYEKIINEYLESYIKYNLLFQEAIKMSDIEDIYYNKEKSIDFSTNELLITDTDVNECICRKE